MTSQRHLLCNFQFFWNTNLNYYPWLENLYFSAVFHKLHEVVTCTHSTMDGNIVLKDSVCSQQSERQFHHHPDALFQWSSPPEEHCGVGPAMHSTSYPGQLSPENANIIARNRWFMVRPWVIKSIDFTKLYTALSTCIHLLIQGSLPENPWSAEQTPIFKQGQPLITIMIMFFLSTIRMWNSLFLSLQSNNSAIKMHNPNPLARINTYLYI